MTLWAKFRNLHLYLPNSLSVARGILALFLPFLILSGNAAYYLTAFVLFIIGAFTDFLDGYLARLLRVESPAGKFMDPVTDKMLILLTLISFAQIGLYSIWLLLPIILREILITFFRIGWLLEGKAVAAEKLGKWKFASQVALAISSFAYLLSFEHGFFVPLRNLSYFCIFVFLGAALFLTLYSAFTLCLHSRELFRSEKFHEYIAACGVGLIPWAPGTWGSLLGLAIAAVTVWNFWFFFATFIAAFAAGYWAIAGMDLKKNKDPGFVVMDEFLGMMLPYFFVRMNLFNAVIGFCLFRLFDITKPFPLRRLERFPGFHGIMYDDFGAGVYTAIALYLIGLL